MRVVIDTNVLVSGLLNALGAPGRIVDGMLIGELVPVVDDRILAEYEEVLARPRFRFDPVQRDGVLLFIREAAERVFAPPLSTTLPDPDDLVFLEVAHAASNVILVTGNLRHFPGASRGGVLVHSPTDFVARWRDRRNASLAASTP